MSPSKTSTLVILITTCSLVVGIPLQNFYPFGHGAQDQGIFPNDDGSSPAIRLTVSFPFFDVDRDTVFVNNNGALSFSRSVATYTPDAFPLSDNQELIAPYWADIDTRAAGSVWYRETADPSVLSRASREISRAFVDHQDFNPVYALVATWDHVGYYNMRVDKTNTFQCVMVTDGRQSFVIFLYADGEIQWTTGDASGGSGGLGGTPAQVGFNAGDGIRFASVPGSQTAAIINIDSTSNVDVPGKWIYQVDEGVRSGGCITDDPQIFITPRHGNMLGGQTVTVQGPCFDQNDNNVCVFDGVEVMSVFVDRFKIVCISPQLSRSGRVPFRLTVNGNPIGQTIFSSLTAERGHQVDVLGDSIGVTVGTRIELRWDAEAVFPALNTSDYTVDIQLYEFDIATQTWKERGTLSTNTENDGIAELTISMTTIPVNRQVAPITVFVFVSHSPSSIASAHPLQQQLITARLKAGKWTAPLYYSSQQLAFRSRFYCEVWYLGEPEGTGESLLASVAPIPCPPNLDQARLPGSGVQQERYSSFYGNTVYNTQWLNYFHPTAAVCYRGRVVNASLTDRAGQQCCYDDRGRLIIDSPGGGSVDRVSQELSRVEHFLDDIYPFVICCKGLLPDCTKYYERRPSHNGSSFVPPPPPGWMFGDPHIVTLDGLKYTFNGRGEFTLIETVDDSFTLQGRMVNAADVNGTQVAATFFSAIVAKQHDSDTVQFVLSRRGLDVLVNGVRIEDVTEIPYNGVTIGIEGNNTFRAIFSSGAYVQVREENGDSLSVAVSLPNSFKGRTRGLMGTYNGNTSDDLVPRSGTNPIPPNSSIQQIHELFGTTWFLNSVNDSLFTYRIYESWNTFRDPDFNPIDEITLATVDPELERLCGGDRFCLFDVAATGRRDVGISTLETSRNVERIIQLSLPVVCDPPCDNGACVANDTCHCAAGFTGERCNQEVFTVCDVNPCLELESCGLKAGSYVCVNCSNSAQNDDYRCNIFNPCASDPCSNGGICDVRSNETYICMCPPGYLGPTCDTPDLCHSGPCINGGTCERLLDDTISFVCICPPGYTGSSCEIDSCYSGPCNNGGICEPLLLNDTVAFKCKCPLGYTGSTCEDSGGIVAAAVTVAFVGLAVAVVIGVVCLLVWIQRHRPKAASENNFNEKQLDFKNPVSPDSCDKYDLEHITGKTSPV